MTPSELKTIADTILPGASRNRQYKHLGGIIGYTPRMLYLWQSGEKEIPMLVADRLREEYRKALRRQAKKDAK